MKLLSGKTNLVFTSLTVFVVFISFVYFQSFKMRAVTDIGSTAVEAEQKMELNWFVSSPSGTYLPDPEEDFVRQTIEKRFDVQLNMIYMEPGEAYDAKLAAFHASNDPPDMWLHMGEDGAAHYALHNVLADMKYYVNEDMMPNYFKYWMSEAELKSYQFHNQFVRAPVPYDKNSYRSYYIRQDWLDRLNLDIPTTYEEYIQVLRAFTYEDPDGNEKADTYGFTTAGYGTSISLEWPEYFKNGLVYPYKLEGKQFIDMQTDPRIEQVIQDILFVLQERLVDPDWFLNDDKQKWNNAIRGRAGIVLGDTKDFAFESNPDSIQARSKAYDPSARWVPFHPFGDQPIRSVVIPDVPFVFSVNAGAEQLKKSAEILDWLAGEEGFLLTHYGREQVHYIRQGKAIERIPSALSDIEQKGDFLKIWSFFTPDTPEVFGLHVIDPRVTETDRSIFEQIISMPVDEGIGTILTPPLGVDVQSFRHRQQELQIKLLLEEKSGKQWPQYREMLLNDTKGGIILAHYEDQVQKALQRMKRLP
ncbi:hypothetical protein [Marinicrinis lubricantis]|uniref:ABC transporter substrate-binding protein n=1 Tax=Marinicrinis lubricantis TaxID=2086470 RepID=A0ABW1ILU5_9BACL